MRGVSLDALAEIRNQQRIRAEKQLAKIQVWLESDDPILVVEAQQFFDAHTQNEKSSLSQTDEVESEQPNGCSMEGTSMPDGFGTPQPKQRRRGKISLKEMRQLHDVLKQPELEVDLAMQAEVEAFFAQYRPENPEDLALAWSAGVYNPLAGMEDTHARLLTPVEEDWLSLARTVGWLLVEDELDAIYFTAPSPTFALEQADWYVRSNLTTFLEEPLLLREVVRVHPITPRVIQGAISQFILQLGWTSQQRKQFVWRVFEKPETEFTEDDWELLLLELQVQNLG